jgi:AraC-like DNA-binding protein/quercetin dioxygenase-like cupin family protein
MQIHRRRQLRSEVIPVDARSSFVVRDFKLRSFEFRWHHHPEVELTLVIRGHGIRYVSDSIESYRAGDLCLIASNIPHTWSSEPAHGPVRSLVVQFSPGLWGGELLQLPESRSIVRLLAMARRGLQVRGRARNRVRKLLMALYRTKTGSPLRVAMLLEILAVMAEYIATDDCRTLAVSNPQSAPAASNSQLLEKVIQRLRDVSQGVPTQAQMAGIIDMSPTAFSRYFKRQMGRTYQRYLTEWRIGRACRLLSETDMKIIDVALKSGYSNLSNFNRRFRQIKAMTPRAYRAASNKDGA